MRWINAEAMVKASLFDEEHEEELTKQMTVEDFLESYTEDGCPTTVEAEPVRHGHWIKKDHVFYDNYRYECSECHHYDEHSESREVPYCWHCGALMDEVNDDKRR